MIKNQRREVILILPYLKVNSTAAERFKSFIQAFQEHPEVFLSVYQVKYPNSTSYFSGMSYENTDDELADQVKINYIFPRLNLIQKLGFKALGRGNHHLWKAIHFLHLIFYQRDVFYPGEIEHSYQKGSKGYIIVSGAHFSYFHSARILAKKIGYKLILDYRDPWTFGYAALGGPKVIHKLKVFLNRKKELSALKYAELVTIVSDSLKQFFPESIRMKVMIIPNGNNFNATEVIPHPTMTFNILYAGTIYNSQLEDTVFFKALAAFINDKKHLNIKLQFIGTAHNKALEQILSSYNLKDRVELSGRVKKEELKAYFNNASLFLHLKYSNIRAIITSKQADYLVFKKPILLPVSDNGDIAESILHNNAGYVCNTVEENLAVLEQLYNKFQNGESLVVPQSEEMLLKNSRAYIAKEFVDLVLKV